MSKRNLSRTLRLLALAAILTLPAPLHAMPLDGFAKGGLLEWLKGVVMSVWEKNGMSIDPSGGNKPTGAPGDEGTTSDLDGGTTNNGDNGMLIDPNG
ncbi:MAG TPA: hypothetical protein VF756_32335 [Thermoanaerobaculia bacterium]